MVSTRLEELWRTPNVSLHNESVTAP